MQDVFMHIQKLIGALHPFGDVLEVGFGPASKEIQKYHPKSHTILTSDPEAVEWAKSHLSVQIMQDIWQSALPQLGLFDTIFFGLDPLNHDFLTRLQYSEQDLDLFCRGIPEKKALSKFLSEVEQNGQISPEIREKMILKYKLTDEKPPKVKRSNQMLLFLKQCLSSHMRKGSRFSCLLKSELDDPDFFNEIIVHPDLDYHQDGLILVIEKLA